MKYRISKQGKKTITAMGIKRMIVNHPDGHKEIVTMNMDDMERLFKKFGAQHPNFGGFEVHFDYNDDNDYDGMIECKEL